MGMYDSYRSAALYELAQQADLEAQNIGSEYNAALTLGAQSGTDPRVADAAYDQKMSALQAMINERAAAIDAEFDAKEAGHAAAMALPWRGGTAGQQLMPQDLGTPYQITPADDDQEPDDSDGSFLSGLFGWFR